MAKKVSKNAKVAQRAANAGSGKDHVKVVKAVKDRKGDTEKLRESIRLGVRRVASSWTGKKPIVDVMIVETA